MLTLSVRRVAILQPTYFYPELDSYNCLRGDAVRGYPPMSGVVLRQGREKVLVRTSIPLQGETAGRFAWIPIEDVQPLHPEE
jgi:hypothetical protein